MTSTIIRATIEPIRTIRADVTKGAVHRRNPTDTVVVSDALVTSIGYSRAYADSVAMSDAVSKTPVKAAADTVTMADAYVTLPPFFTDAASMTDASSMQFTKAAADTVTMSDGVGFTFTKAAADTVTMSDSAQVGQSPIAFRSTTSNASSTTVTKPAGVAAGDFVVVVVADASATGLTLTTSSGSAWNRSEILWSLYGYYSVLFWKVLTSTDVSNNWTLSTGKAARSIAWQPGTTAVSSASLTTAQNSASQSSFSLTSFTPGGTTKGAVTVIVDRDPDTNPTAPSGFTRQASSVLSSFYTTSVADYPAYTGGAITWTSVQGADGFGEVGWVLHVTG